MLDEQDQYYQSSFCRSHHGSRDWLLEAVPWHLHVYTLLLCQKNWFTSMPDVLSIADAIIYVTQDHVTLCWQRLNLGPVIYNEILPIILDFHIFESILPLLHVKLRLYRNKCLLLATFRIRCHKTNILIRVKI